MQGKIAYTNHDQLHIYNFAEKSERILKGLPNLAAPAWHPKGRWLAYGSQQIILVDTFGKDVKLLSSPKERHYYPAWHPQKNLLAYGLQSSEGSALIFHDLDKNETQKLKLPFDAVFQLAWHPNAEDIAFVALHQGQKQLFQMNTNQLNNFNISSSLKRLSDKGRFNHAPAWHPQGSILAYESYLEEEKRWVIMLRDADGNNQSITAHPYSEHHPSWSPDGSSLAVERQNQEKPGAEIFLINQAGETLERISIDGGREPDWIA